MRLPKKRRKRREIKQRNIWSWPWSPELALGTRPQLSNLVQCLLGGAASLRCLGEGAWLQCQGSGRLFRENNIHPGIKRT